MTGVPFVY